MGGRGAFRNVSINDFTFVTGIGKDQKTFSTIDEIDGVQIIVQVKGLSTNSPVYSHTPNRKYAVIQKGKLKHIAFYDENNKRIKEIDFGHVHNNLIPHVHFDIEHKKPAQPLSEEDWKIVNKIRKIYSIDWNKK